MSVEENIQIREELDRFRGDLLVNTPKRSKEELNAYFDGARGGIRLWARWHDGVQYVGSGIGSTGTTLERALQMVEDMRQAALIALEKKA